MLIPRNLPEYEEIESLVRGISDADPRVLEAWLVILRMMGDLVSSFERFFAGHSLSEGRFTVLMSLYRASRSKSKDQRALSPADLAAQARVTRATITGLLDGLEQAGYVKREPRKDDRRMIAVSLTPSGARFLEGMLPRHFRRVSALMSALSERDRNRLVSLMRRLRQGIARAEATDEHAK